MNKRRKKNIAKGKSEAFYNIKHQCNFWNRCLVVILNRILESLKIQNWIKLYPTKTSSSIAKFLIPSIGGRILYRVLPSLWNIIILLRLYGFASVVEDASTTAFIQTLCIYYIGLTFSLLPLWKPHHLYKFHLGLFFKSIIIINH